MQGMGRAAAAGAAGDEPMNTDLATLMMRYRAASQVLVLLDETGASDTVLAEQLAKCRELRRELNSQCPDNPDYDPHEGNIVAVIGERFGWRQ